MTTALPVKAMVLTDPVHLISVPILYGICTSYLMHLGAA
jgi:hypothetical protein